ncbi:MAG: riboflavin synthase [Proteobacteria bacterium]|nr:riboflavin synthase [Pseudomonadota bacterium]NCA28716.1 riboflavin synthase [Pseudomonadota bacterium]
MFTGIITHQATIKKINFIANKDTLLTIEIPKKQIKRKLKIGCSIACNGICLTLISQKILSENLQLSFQASQETLQKTTLKNWRSKEKINIELSMRLNDEFGGHLVSGHIDCTTKIIGIKKIKDSWQFDFATPKDFKKFLSPKGSIAINGTSLTLNQVNDKFFSINIIEHTIKNTTFQFAKIEDLVNLEIDLIARYLFQMLKK